MFKVGADALALAKTLRNIQEGEEITYKALSKSINADVQEKKRGSLETARRILLRDNQMVFAPVRGIGLRRLLPGEVVEHEQRATIVIRKAIHRSAKRLSTVEPEKLVDKELISHSVVSATLAAAAYSVSQPARHKIEQAVRDTGKLNLGDTMKLFSANTK